MAADDKDEEEGCEATSIQDSEKRLNEYTCSMAANRVFGAADAMMLE